ncbi:MAG: outer membrane protein assembly factor BamC [Gammaproteobacteria bacterium]
MHSIVKNSMVKKGVLLAIMLTLTGCSTWQESSSSASSSPEPLQTTQYNQATSVPPVKTPPKLSSENLVKHYPITSKPATNQELLTPPPSAVPPSSGLPPSTSAAQPVPATPTPQTQTATQYAEPNVEPRPQTTTAATPPAPTSSAPSSGPVIVAINYDYSKAWDKVGQALRASGYRVLQQDSSLGRYYVLDLAGTNGKLQRNTPIYQVHLIEIGNGKTQLNLLNSSNKPADGNTARRILGAVQQKLGS